MLFLKLKNIFVSVVNRNLSFAMNPEVKKRFAVSKQERSLGAKRKDSVWRRERDSNPRSGLTEHTISSRAP